jgi:DNA-binding XRE family transcriptional regulator
MTDRLQRGHVLLDSAQLRQLRQSRLMSQQDLANDCWRRNIPLSLTTIKRAELGRPVRFRIAREFARCFDIPVTRIVRTEGAIAIFDLDTH